MPWENHPLLVAQGTLRVEGAELGVGGREFERPRSEVEPIGTNDITGYLIISKFTAIDNKLPM